MMKTVEEQTIATSPLLSANSFRGSLSPLVEAKIAPKPIVLNTSPVLISLTSSIPTVSILT